MSCLGDDLVLHSFPPRRSSDLGYIWIGSQVIPRGSYGQWVVFSANTFQESGLSVAASPPAVAVQSACLIGMTVSGASRRSEEHTSELQSRENLVCRLLLEKKKR